MKENVTLEDLQRVKGWLDNKDGELFWEEMAIYKETHVQGASHPLLKGEDPMTRMTLNLQDGARANAITDAMLDFRDFIKNEIEEKKEEKKT